MSLYVDSLTNKTLETTFRGLYEIQAPYLSEYFDFFAMLIVLVFSGKPEIDDFIDRFKRKYNQPSSIRPPRGARVFMRR